MSTVAGRLMNVREMGKLAFGVLQDVSGRIQLFVSRQVLGGDEFERFLALDAGDWIGATGEVIKTKKGELSVRVESFTLLTKSLRPLPEKWHGLKDIEARSRRRYVDLMVNDHARETALARATIVSELRRQFEERGFVEVETPILVLRRRRVPSPRPFSLPTTTPSTSICDFASPPSCISSAWSLAGWSGSSKSGGSSATRASTPPTTRSSPCSRRTRRSPTTRTSWG